MQIQTSATVQAQRPYLPTSIKKSTVEPANLVAYWFKDADGKLFRRWISESKF